MEIADIFVINKCDRDGADQLERGIRTLLAMGRPGVDEAPWAPPIIKTVASEGKGIAELAQSIAGFQEYLQKTGMGTRRRVDNWRRRLLEMLRSELMHRLAREYLSDEAARRLAAEIAAGRKDPYSVVEDILTGIGIKNEE
jgi:LAO/AO transport system kinase